MFVKNVKNIPVATGMNINFPASVIAIGDTFVSPGVYRVDLSASGAVSTAAGNLDLVLTVDGVPVEYTEVVAYSGANTDVVNLSIGTYVRVPAWCSCKNQLEEHSIAVLNRGNAANYNSVTLTVSGGGYCE